MATFTEAVMNSMTAALDPSHAMTRDYMKSVIAEKQQELQLRKAEGIASVAQLLAKAKEDKDTDPSVISSYQRVLAAISK